MHRASLRSVLSTARRSSSSSSRTAAVIGPRNALSALRPATATAAAAAAAAHFSSAANPQGTMKPSKKKLSVGLLSGLVLVGAWFYKDNIASAFDRRGLLPLRTAPAPAAAAAAAAAAPAPAPAAAAPTHLSSSPPNPAAAARLLPQEDDDHHHHHHDEDKPKYIIAVDNESLYTGTLPAGQKVSKEVDSSGRKVVEMLTPEQATEKLRRNEESYIVGRGRGVWRYDVVQIPSNDPIEDDHDEKIIEVPQTVSPAGEAQDGGTSDWMFWGVFDGHSGWTTSAKLRQTLIVHVARELNATYKAALSDPDLTLPTSDSVDAAIKNAFVRLDNEIVHESVDKVFKNPSKLVAAETLAPALSGSCGLLAFYESRSRLLKVAVTGDSRAVLGRRAPNGKWTATALSEDQTGSNAAEEARMRAEHPGEDHVIRNGRVLGGLEPTRAFGDAFYKWSVETQLKIKKEFFGRTPSQLLKTPPYVTAEPVVTTTQIHPENGDFLILATDGLWEMLTNEEVVGLVGRWIEEQKSPAQKASGKPWFGGLFGGGKADGALPVEGETSEGTGQRQPIRMRQWGVTAKESERFVWEDNNAATHLVRNALGGRNKDMLCALLTLPSPYSRRYRDDLTVEVIFFGDGADKSGNVTVNEDATATAKKVDGEVKAKL